MGNQLEKSSLDPSQSLEHLGFVLNSKEMTFSLPGKKIRDIRKSYRPVIQRTKVSPRIIHSLTMRIRAAAMAIFPTNMYTQALMFFKNRYVRRRHHWDQEVVLPQDARQELDWWQANLAKRNGRALLNPEPDKNIYVDTSNAGCGGVGMGKSGQGVWSHEEVRGFNKLARAQGHRTHTSFFQVAEKLDHPGTLGQYHRHSVHQQTGWYSVPIAEPVGNDDLEKVLKRGHLLKAKQHIPGYLNTEADLASRHFQAKNMWQICLDTYRTTIQPKFDLFADRTSHLLPKYFSRMLTLFQSLTGYWTQ
jgi:hypothetical protein